MDPSLAAAAAGWFRRLSAPLEGVQEAGDSLAAEEDDELKLTLFVCILVLSAFCAAFIGNCYGACVRPKNVFHLKPEDVKETVGLDGLTAEELNELVRELKLNGKMAQTDLPTRGIYYLVIRSHEVWDAGQRGTTELAPTLEQIQPKKAKLRMVDHGVGGFSTPHFDEDFAPTSFTELLGVKFLQVQPLCESTLRFDSVEEAFVYRQMHYGDVLPPPQEVDPWDDVTSDEAISRIAFYGFAVTSLVRIYWAPKEVKGACWKIDFAYMSKFEVRKGGNYERYGATAYFDKQERILGIFWCHGHKYVYPGDAEWEHVKWCWKCSVSIGMAYGQHLAVSHWIVSNALNVAAREDLGHLHPIRRLLEPHMFRTALINTRAGITLVPEGGILHRLTMFTAKAHAKVLEHAAGAWDYDMVRVPKWLKRQGLSEHSLPYAEDSMALWRVLSTYVTGYVALFYADDAAVQEDAELRAFWNKVETQRAPDYAFGLPELTKDSLAELLTAFLWTVTGWHEIVGNFAEVFAHPESLGGKIREGQVMNYVTDYTENLSLLCLTALKMPHLMNDWKRVYLYSNEVVYRRCCDLHDDLQASLRELSDTIQRKNTNGSRKWSYNWLNPLNLEVSLSL